MPAAITMTERKAKATGLDFVALLFIVGTLSFLIYGKTAHKSTPGGFPKRRLSPLDSPSVRIMNLKPMRHREQNEAQSHGSTSKARVAVVRCPSYEPEVLSSAVRQSLELVGGNVGIFSRCILRLAVID